MSYRVILSPDAKAGIRSAIRWYVQWDKELRARFESDLKAILERIAQHPGEFRLIRGPVRRALMKRFPYAVYFILSGGVALVVGVEHQRRFNPLNRP